MVYLDDPSDEDWIEDDGPYEEDLLVCPSCRAQVHEDTQQCPYCRDWITPVDASSPSRRWGWMIVVMVMILLVVMMSLL